MQQPLKNKTIIVTRSENQASDFITQLKNLGAKTIALPLIKNTPTNQEKLSSKLNQNNYSWIIFTSPNAVQFFFDTISPKDINSKIATVGSKTKELINTLGLTVDFIPTQFTAKQLATEIPVTENDTILIPRSNLAKNDIVEILENKNCSIDTIAIYENTSVHYSTEELDTIFKQQIDFITFTSGSTVASFMKLGIELNQEKIICIGPETAKVASDCNLLVSGVANPHTIEGMIDEIKKPTSIVKYWSVFQLYY